jgi:predicted nucleic acid-binding protein
MSVDAFLDTNVLIYAVSSAPEEMSKKDRALELIEQEDFGLSAQVLQEFYVSVTRKIANPIAPDPAVELLEQFRQFPMVLTDYPLLVAGVEISLRYGISYWDGAIVAAADVLGASILYSEDLGDGQVYGSVRVVNPFRRDGTDGAHEAAPQAYPRS